MSKFKVFKKAALAQICYEERDYDFSKPNARENARSNFERLDLSENDLDRLYKKMKEEMDTEFEQYKAQRLRKPKK